MIKIRSIGDFTNLMAYCYIKRWDFFPFDSQVFKEWENNGNKPHEECSINEVN